MPRSTQQPENPVAAGFDADRMAGALAVLKRLWLTPASASGESERLDAATEAMLTLLGLIRQPR
jgi:hypothetical protein